MAKWSPTKDSNKEKDKEREKDRTNWDSLWKQLWQIYPKKYAENSARSQFYGLMNSGVLSDQVLEESVFPAITALKGSRRWTERAGAFVPKLSDFLIDQRWIEGLELLERKKRGGNGENSRYRPEVPGNRPGGAFSDVDLIQG